MAKLIIVIAVWAVIFALRVVQVGGIDPAYFEEGNQILRPLRENLSYKLGTMLPYPQSSLLSGIILGDGRRIPFFLKENLKSTSTIHIVVVSGQNLTILAGFVMGLVSYIGRRKTIILTLCVIVLYSVLTGLQIPVIRAAVMVTMAYLAQLLGKEGTGWWVLALTGGLMLLFNPNWLLNISFQLSFLATFGVVVVAPILLKYFKKVPRLLREDLAVTFSAQILVLPIIAYNFYQVSALGILANSLVLWSIPVIMISGFFTIVFGLVNFSLGQIIGLVPTILLTYFVDVINFFAHLSISSFQIGETGIVLWMGYYLVIGGAIWMMKIRNADDRG